MPGHRTADTPITLEVVDERTIENAVRRECKQRLIRDSLDRYYLISGTVTVDTERYEALCFPTTADTPYEERTERPICASTDSIDACQEILEAWLNGSGDRGDAPSAMQAFVWIQEDQGEDAAMAWMDDEENNKALFDQLAGGLRMGRMASDPKMMLSAMLGLGMMLGLDLDELPDDLRERLSQMGFDL